MTKLLQSLFLFLFLSALSCSSGERLLNDAEWLKGTWASEKAQGILYETWTEGTDSSLSAKSYYLNAEDTVLFETVELVESNSKLYYIVSVPKEKKETPVRFESIAVYEDSMIFENKSNFFPQKIKYQRVAKNSLVAEVSGIIEGNLESEQFRMSKIK